MKKIFPSALLLFFVLLSQNAVAAGQSPGMIVKTTVDRVLDVLDDKALDEEQKRRIIYQTAGKNIDFREMSQRILAVNWKLLSEDQQVEFVFLFEKILLGDYWARIRNYSGERVEYLAVSVDQNRFATVDTVIVRPEGRAEIPITYRMLLRSGEWVAYDFLVEDLSLVQNYRTEYQAIIKNNGVEGLLEYMNSDI